ncbi:MAG: hypothetical protein JWN95_453 [Frankiales bacterium]|nr:hypothetical protein [Frankiales bacterium]
MKQPHNFENETSTLGVLRSLIPRRPLGFADARRIAEFQADRLLNRHDVHDEPVPTELVLDLPRVVVEFDGDLPGHAASGFSDWDAHRRLWVITINPDEPATRQRFTMLHELKHIIDHDRLTLASPMPRTIYGLPPIEYLADYFAGCVLMPKRMIRAAYYDGIQRPGDLAELFDVSTRAVEVRLAQLGLTAQVTPPPMRNYRRQPRPRLGRYQRLSSWSWTTSDQRHEVRV